VAVIGNWRDDPMAAIRQRVQDALNDLYPEALKEPVPDDLGAALGAWAERIRGPVLVILDQFEEYFLYRAQEDGPGSFAQEFPEIVNSGDILANFVIAIREDVIASLDRFKARLPNLFDNYIRIRHLNRTAAARAITGPIDAYNRSRPRKGTWRSSPS